MKKLFKAAVIAAILGTGIYLLDAFLTEPEVIPLLVEPTVDVGTTIVLDTAI